MAKPAHTKHITITRRTAPRPVSQDKDAERFRLRLVNDQKRADLALERDQKRDYEYE
nr:hypothetical protein [Halomonas sp.]|tara:strand:- start:10460 stop:10630 length:171 start_codon:yes stop_codon:yes gene_type:complete